MRRPAWLVLALGIGLGGGAQAGRTHFGWLYGTDTLPERGVELESWVQDQGGLGTIDQTWLWWAPVFGVTDRLELALPVEWSWSRDDTKTATRFERFGAELRWRLVDPDPVEAGPFAALLRLGVKRVVSARNSVRFEGGVVLALDVGPARLAADLGATYQVDKDGTHALTATPMAGVSVAVTDELRVGAELVTALQVDDNPALSWVAAGPNLSYTHGRAWISGSFLIGIHNIDLAPRLTWGIGF
jgi:hypothetical protein